MTNDTETNGTGLTNEVPSLLIVDDDRPFLHLLTRAMGKRGYTVTAAETVADAKKSLDGFNPDYAVIDLRLNDGNGLDVLEHLKRQSPLTRSLILSGYVNLPSAVAAVKAGAVDCLPKPVDADEIDVALRSADSDEMEMPDHFMQPGEARIQHILARWEKNDRNTTKTADELGLHRRSLQRMLQNAGVDRGGEEDIGSAGLMNRFKRLYQVWSRGLPNDPAA